MDAVLEELGPSGVASACAWLCAAEVRRVCVGVGGLAAGWLGQASSMEQAGAAGSRGAGKRALGVCRLQETRVCLGCGQQEGEAAPHPSPPLS